MTGPRLPPPVVPGDRVGVAALSGPVRPERLDAGLAALRELGFEPVEATNLRSRTRSGLFAGTDDERLDAFHRLAADPEIKAIVFARGGHGLLRLLPRLDWDLLARHPRAYVGYSDLTPFLLQVVERLSLVSFHGPMVAADLARGLDDGERASFLGALRGDYPAEIRFERGFGRRCEGVLLGGCLSLLVSTLGTAWAPKLDGAILFFEDLNEPLYRFDRMLTHLGLSGSLTGIQGMIVGHLTRVGEEDGSAGRPWALLREMAKAMGRSLAWGLPAGHAAPNLTLPLGLRARLEPRRRRLVIGSEP